MDQPSSHYFVTLLRKGRELGRWKVGNGELKIGRTAENHIVIDNVLVSRLHAVIEMTERGAVIRDCGSHNGILVNGARVAHAVLTHGDTVTIGGHDLVCRVAGPDGSVAADPPLFEASILSNATRQPAPVASPGVLVETSAGRERQHVLDRGLVVIGGDRAADIVVPGPGIAPYHVEIRFLNGRYALRHIDGKTPVKVDGRVVREYMLADGCVVSIGAYAFVFHTRAGVAHPS